MGWLYAILLLATKKLLTGGGGGGGVGDECVKAVCGGGVSGTTTASRARDEVSAACDCDWGSTARRAAPTQARKAGSRHSVVQVPALIACICKDCKAHSLFANRNIEELIYLFENLRLQLWPPWKDLLLNTSLGYRQSKT